MKTSAAGLQKLERREGRRLVAYQDSRGIWTIGVGMTTFDGHPVRRGMQISAEQCDAEFARQLVDFEAAVLAAIAPHVPTQNQFDACVSLCWNIGKTGFAGSTVARKLRAGDIDGAADAFMLWVKPSVLHDRRVDEVAQFRAPDGPPVPVTTFAPPHIGVPATAAPAPGFWANLAAAFGRVFSVRKA